MRPGGRKADDSIANLHPRPVDNGVFLDNTDTEAGEIVVVAVVDARHLGRLTANERGARLDAALGDPLMTDSATSTRSFPVA